MSFTLSQIGMVRHWTRLLRTETDAAARSQMMRSRVINTIGCICTGDGADHRAWSPSSLAGAWIAILAMGVLFVIMKMIHKHYATASRASCPSRRRGRGTWCCPAATTPIVLVSKRAPADRSGRWPMRGPPGPTNWRPSPSASTTPRRASWCAKWEDSDIAVPLKVIASPYREITRPVLDYVKRITQGLAAYGRHGLHSRVRRRALVGTGPAQPERTAAQGPPAVRAAT